MIEHYFAAKAALLAKSSLVGFAAAIAGAVIDDRTHVPLGPTLAVGVFVAGIVFWIGQKMQSLTDEIKDVKDHICELNKRLHDLPCKPDQRPDICKSSEG